MHSYFTNFLVFEGLGSVGGLIWWKVQHSRLGNSVMFGGFAGIFPTVLIPVVTRSGSYLLYLSVWAVSSLFFAAMAWKLIEPTRCRAGHRRTRVRSSV